MDATPSLENSALLTAIILAAGQGTRMKSGRAKVLHELCGRPLVAFAIAQARAVGATRIVVVVGHQADEVRVRAGALFPSGVEFALQEEQLGTGHAVRIARDAAGLGEGEVLVLSGDVPLVRPQTLATLVRARRESGAAIALVTSDLDEPTGYGRVLKDESGRVLRVVEHRDANASERAVHGVNMGLYAFDAKFLGSALDALKPDNAQGELYLTDLIGLANANGREVVATKAPYAETRGINDRAELAEAEASLRREINLALMKSGVTMRDPSSTYVELGVEVADDVEIEPQVSLRGKTRIATGARIGQGAVIVDSTIGEGAEVKPYSHLDGAVVGARSLVGPFSRLRPGTELAEEVHVGNFVETKKARIGAKSKANHLTYLGDAVIGQGCNIGAGTITCNYDGAKKYETRMGDGVFIGSDTQLVAPVALGDNAYVGAGSTITKDVPADALAFTRPPLTVKEGWVARRKAKLAESAVGESKPKKAGGT